MSVFCSCYHDPYGLYALKVAHLPPPEPPEGGSRAHLTLLRLRAIHCKHFYDAGNLPPGVYPNRASVPDWNGSLMFGSSPSIRLS